MERHSSDRHHRCAPRGITVRRLRWLLLCATIIGLAGCQWLRSAAQSDDIESQRLLEQARHAVLAGDLDHAHNLLNRAGSVSPADPDVHCQRAELMQAQGQTAGAITHLRYAADKEPANVQTQIRLACLLLQQGRTGEAEVAAATALSLDPRNPEALELKATLAEQRERPDVALETYHRLLAEDPGNVRARMGIAAIQIRLGQPDRAAPLLREVCRSSQATPHDRAEAQWSLGVAYGAASRWADAVAELSSASQVRTEMKADDWYRLAYARMCSEDFGGARADLEIALQEQPEHAAALAMQSALDDRVQLESHGGGHSILAYPVPEGWPPEPVAASPDSLRTAAVPD